jgi:hypothetical protein
MKNSMPITNLNVSIKFNIFGLANMCFLTPMRFAIGSITTLLMIVAVGH